MGRYRTYGGLDTQLIEEGDTGFTGLNMKHERGILPQGTLARSENKRLRRLKAETRKGTALPDFANGIYSDFILGSGVYSNPNKDENLLVAERGANFVWSLRWSRAPAKISLSDGQTIPNDIALVWFVQAFDKVLLLRGDNFKPMVWDGIDPVGFKLITKSNPGDTSTKLIPNCYYGESFANRILYIKSRQNDTMIMSDVLDYTSYDPVEASIRINAGEADTIQRIYPYSPDSVVIYMKRSTHMLSNFTIDPTMDVQQVISHQLGLVGLQAVTQVGGDLFFLSQPGGIYRLNQVFERNMATQPVSISDPIQPIIDRINWAAAYYSSAAVLGEYVYFAVPLDDAAYPNTVLVFNSASGTWESIDTRADAPNFYIISMWVTEFEGVRRLYGINHLTSSVYLLDEGISDQIALGADPKPIRDLIETRGYGASMASGPGSFKSFRFAKIGMETYSPSVRVTAISDGFNEEKLLTLNPIIKSNKKNYIWGKADFNEYTDDPFAPKRLDYTPDSLGFAFQDFEALPEGPISSLPGNQFHAPVLQKQQSLERLTVRQVGRWCSLRIENTNGQCDVLGASVTGIESENVIRTAA